MAIETGAKLPDATLHTMQDGKPAPVSTSDLFAGKKVAMFAVPGAFTPTCSMAHLPGYVVHADALKAKGVDSIVCLSVNDAFVMDAWGKSANAEELVWSGTAMAILPKRWACKWMDLVLVWACDLSVTL